MNHLSDDQLSARLDGALNASEDAAAGRHLDDCPECRDRLAALSELDASLRGALAHDPGEQYFASFADRVGEKIAAAAPAASPVAAPSSGGLFGWWRSPRMLALVGSTAAVLAVAAVALKLSSDRGVEGFASDVAPGTEVGAPPAEESAPAPAAGAVAERQQADAVTEREAAPAPSSLSSPRNEAAPVAPPAERRSSAARAQEVRTLSGGEQVAVPRRDLPAVTQRSAPVAPAPAPTSAETRVIKPQAASSMTSTPANRAPEPVETAKGAAADVAAPAVTPRAVPPAQVPAPAAEPVRKSRFDVRNQFEMSKASVPAPSPATGSSSQSLAPPAAGGSVPFTAPSAPAPGSKPAARGELTTRFRSTPYEAALEAATQAERVAQRERSATAWDRAAAAWTQAASVAVDESQVRAARRSAADARMTAWRTEGTDARRAAALSAVDACIAAMPAGRQQDEARRWKAELER
jgi:hypothetical protein